MITSAESKSQELPEDYLDAQRAAVEAVHVGREALEQTDRQGEQLLNTSRLADQTKHALEKSSRLLRGMTWSGLVQNVFSRDFKSPASSIDGIVEKPILIEEIPPFAKAAAQAILNYQANLTILQTCESYEQRDMCQLICKEMFEAAAKELDLLRVDSNPTVVQHLSRHLAKLHQYQKDISEKHNELQKKSNAFESISSANQTGLSDQQEGHLTFLASNLAELNIMAGSLYESIEQQNIITQQLQEKSDTINEETKAVTRRADRLVQNKNWMPARKKFEKWVSIKHVESGRYVSISKTSVVLVDAFHPETCVYGVWMRENGLFGLKNKFSNRFVGQTMLGSLACSSSIFGQREEWQVDENWNESTLLIASAGWGQGGYIALKNSGIVIVSKKNKADIWCIAEL